MKPLAALLTLFFVLTTAQAAKADGFAPCGGSATDSCGTVTVPLDRSGAVPGSPTSRVRWRR